jgi:DNA-binding NtrC family response regulator
MDGIQLLDKVKESYPETEALLISAYGSVKDAVKAMQLGAADFMTKPFSPEELRARVKKIFQKIENGKIINQLRDQNEYLQEEISNEYEEMVGSSKLMREIFGLIDRIAKEESSVLIQGESGTGKELVARAIHRKSRRSKSPFIRINCGALNDNLLESELFGHEKGAFTGAIQQKRGRFELAHKGTLFLDEIGDVSQAMQVKLLRVLQEKEFERVGGENTIPVDVRIIAATNKDLNHQLHDRTFREDLYYRLSVIPIQLPSLRERKEDIPLLIGHFLNRINEKKAERKSISGNAIEILQQYPWPGNIRELENLIERLYIISNENEISMLTVSQYLGQSNQLNGTTNNMQLEQALFNFEKQMISQAMKKSNGVKNQAAKLLGIRTSTLYYKLEKFGLI